jgi:hypothetical protein
VAETESVNAVIEKGLDYLRRRIRIDAAEKMSLAERIRLGSELALDCNLDLELHLYSSRALADARPSNFAGYIIAHGKRLI